MARSDVGVAGTAPTNERQGGRGGTEGDTVGALVTVNDGTGQNGQFSGGGSDEGFGHTGSHPAQVTSTTTSSAATTPPLRRPTAAERAVLKRGMWSLVREHWQLVLLLSFNLVMMDNNMVFTYFLLVQTNVSCAYHAEDGAYVQSQTVALLAVMAWRPFSGLLTDALPRHNHVLLLGSALLEFGGLLAMLLLVAVTNGSGSGGGGGQLLLSPWPVLGLSIFKQCVEVQLLASTYKIFKMRLRLKCRLGTCDSQCHVISAVSIVGELAELVFNILTCGVAYALMSNGASFEEVKYVYFSSTLAATVLCVGLAFSIACRADSFYAATGVGKALGGDAAAQRAKAVTGGSQGQRLQSPLLGDSGGGGGDGGSGGASPRAGQALVVGAQGGGGTGSGNGAAAEPRQRCGLCRSLKGVFCVPLAAGCILAMTVLYSAQELLYNVESLDIPGRHVSNATATPENFCAGYLVNTVYQDVWENMFYLLGTVFYILVLKRMQPLAFFRFLLPIAMAVLVAVAAVISLPDVAQLVLALALESVVAFEYFFFLYAKYLSIAAVASEFYGMYAFVVGMMQSLVDLVIYGAMELKVSDYALQIAMYCFMGAALAVGLGFSFTHSRTLRGASKHCE